MPPSYPNDTVYPLSVPQKSIWYTEQFYPGTSIGNISATMRLKAPIDFPLLEQAINLLIRNNDSLRIRLHSVGGVPHQYVADYTWQSFEVRDFSLAPPDALYEWDRQETLTPFFGEDVPLFRFTMLQIDAATCGYLVILHHIISDAWSLTLVGNEIMRYYLLLRGGNSDTEPRPSYLQYLREEETYLASDRYRRDAAFWREQFETLPDAAVVKPRLSRDIGTQAARKSFLLPRRLCEKIREHAALSGASVFSIFIGAFVMYLYRATGKQDIVLGVPVLNRNSAKAKAAIGMFISTIPFRIQVDGEESYSDFSRALTAVWMQLLRRQRYPLDDILRDVRSRFGDVERLYDVVFSYQNARFERSEDSENLQSRWHFCGHQNESLSIHINDRDGDGVIVLNYDYLEALFHTKDIEALHDHYIRLLWHSLDSPHKPIKAIHMISEPERKQILGDFNHTGADFPRERTMLDFFIRRAALSPNTDAILFADRRLSYRQLSDRADAIARGLAASGVGRGDIVALLVQRGPDMMAAILAAWKCGACYLPIDPRYPRERIAYLLQDSAAAAVLCQPGLEQPADYTGSWLDLASPFPASGPLPADLPHPEDLAYIIYTSGSTGNPKGVMVEHRALVNRIHWMNRQYPLSPDDVILQKTTYTFDVSVWELVWWFYAGVPLVFLPPEEEKFPDRLADAIEWYAVTTLHFVPSMLGGFLDYLAARQQTDRVRTLRRVFASGEALTPRHVNRFYQLLGETGPRLHNLYGPTEAAIDVSYYECPPSTRHRFVPIGKPIDNLRLYILDGHGNLQPVGIPGELYIGGVGLARGYLNRPELTAERFVDSPLEPGEKLYKTGDLARWFPRGDIEYLGRLDFQVKIRGFRIELGEIRHRLEAHPAVREAVVACRQRDSDSPAGSEPYLAAYYVAAEDVEEDALRGFLAQHLPDYMVPARFVPVDAIPLSPNGKADIRRLPAPTATPKPAPAASADPAPPRTPREELVLRVWREVLAKPDLGATDDFFQAGGDSISAIDAVCRMPVPVNVSKLYEYPVLADFARHYQERPGGGLLRRLAGDSGADTAYLLCPYGGGGAYIYRDLAAAIVSLHPEAAVFSLSLPGHDFGADSGRMLPVRDVAALALQEIGEHMGGRIVLYAHCVGSALGIELTRLLELAGHSPDALILGGILPPVLPGMYGPGFDPWRFVGDKALTRYLQSLGLHTDIPRPEAFLRAFRHDVREYFRYLHRFTREQTQPLFTPIHTILGAADKMTRGIARRPGWEQFGEEGRREILPDAGHYFPHTHPDELAALLLAIPAHMAHPAGTLTRN
ncbi:amino acid adenylation domain-containing protein [Ruminococcaceae bacterium OttesenSCG-928-L11]|nr:amino acid adenylation domain-containing protein [Ruminococcaceae bacterium OttesenSCG-928-L11]